MTLSAIRTILESHLAATTPALPAIAWPNVPFTPTVGTPYIAAEFIPVLRRPVVVGPTPEQRTSGMLYLTVCTPEARGAAAGYLVVDQLLSRFRGHISLSSGGITVSIEYSEAKMALHNQPFYVIPVEIGWYSYTSG
jgi:hypothetical protein